MEIQSSISKTFVIIVKAALFSTARSVQLGIGSSKIETQKIKNGQFVDARIAMTS